MLYVVGGLGYVGNALVKSLKSSHTIGIYDPNIFGMDINNMEHGHYYWGEDFTKLDAKDDDVVVFANLINDVDILKTKFGRNYLEIISEALKEFDDRNTNARKIILIDYIAYEGFYKQIIHKTHMSKYEIMLLPCAFGFSDSYRIDTPVNQAVCDLVIAKQYDCRTWYDVVSVASLETVVELVTCKLEGNGERESDIRERYVAVIPFVFIPNLIMGMVEDDNISLRFSCNKKDRPVLDREFVCAIPSNFVTQLEKFVLTCEKMLEREEFMEDVSDIRFNRNAVLNFCTGVTGVLSSDIMRKVLE